MVIGGAAFNEFGKVIAAHPDVGRPDYAGALVNIGVSFILTMALVVALSFAFAHLMNMPLKELVGSAQAVSEGEFKKVRAKTGDEVELLGEAFNTMAEKVRQREGELIVRGQHLALLYSLAEALNRQRPVEEIFAFTMGWFDTVFGFEVGALRLLHGDTLGLAASKGIGPGDLEKIQTVRLGESVAGIVAQKGALMTVEDISGLSEPYALTSKRLGLECLACIPLKSGDRLIGTLSVGSRSKGEYHKDMDMLNSVGNLLGIAIERARRFDEIEQERFEWETAVAFLNDLVSIHDSQWRIKKVNPAFVKHFGLKENEVVGRHCYEVFHGTDAPLHECPCMRP